MATYYVRTDGSDTNAGTGPATNQAWQTITKAIGATGIAPGDTLYIAPGIYRGSFTAGFTNPSSEGQRITIAGNPTASQFSGVSAGPVIFTNYTGSTSYVDSTILTCVKNYITLQDIYVVGRSPTSGLIATMQTTALIMDRVCSLQNENTATTVGGFRIYVPDGTAGPIVRRCVFQGQNLFRGGNTTSYNSGTLIQDCLFLTSTTSSDVIAPLTIGNFPSATFGGITVVNSTFISSDACIGFYTGSTLSTSHPNTYRNCSFQGLRGIVSTSTSAQNESYNFFNCQTDRTNCSTGTGSVSKAYNPFDMQMSYIQGWGNYPHYSPMSSASMVSAGNNTNILASDIFGTTWLNSTTPTVGAVESATLGTGAYQPTERNASAITIAPGSTSQSIELYLGATGLTASTSGLSARYNRTRTASVSIPLVARTIAQAWISGGFAEVDATNMPGVYRIDLPDAALAAGADDVTIVVRGASGTNGAVMTIKLSSGGLTQAQTASAVFNALTADYTTHGTYGWNLLRADQGSKEGLVTLHQSGGVSRVDADIHAIVNDTDAATELKGALLHNGTDYISADLLTPVSAATSVHMGPYMLLADGLGADQPLDVNIGTATAIDVQVVDANGTGIDITGATVSAKVYNSGGTLVATYAGTATYADNGRLSFGLTTTVTNTAGTYTVTVTRTTGASDTEVFGPLKLYVRPV